MVVSFFTFFFGMLVGSFLNVVILRLPHDKSIVFPASHCPSCSSAIAWYDNVPVVSFLLLKGRCRTCGVSISWQYPIVELAMGLLSLALFVKFQLSWSFAINFVLVAALLVIMVIDFHHQIIPDVISLSGILVGFCLSFVNSQVTWQSAGLGILLGGGSLYAIATIYYLITKREGMGGGDIKLLAMIGAFQGWQSLPFVIFSSSLLGSLVGIGFMFKQKKGGKTVVPYGPFLAIGSILYMFFQKEVGMLYTMFFVPR